MDKGASVSLLAAAIEDADLRIEMTPGTQVTFGLITAFKQR